MTEPLPPLRLLPNIEALVTAFINADPDLAPLVGGRVYSQLPSQKTYPLVRVTRYAGAPVFREPLELDRAALQLDVWGASKSSAHAVVTTLRAALAYRFAGGRRTYGNGLTGVVCAVEFGQLAYSPDTTFDPAIPRYIADIDVTYRP